MDVGDNPQLTMEVMVKIQDKHTTSNTDLVLHTHTQPYLNDRTPNTYSI